MKNLEKTQNIIIFHAGALGDMINTLPAITSLKNRFPDAKITAIGNLSNLTLMAAAGIIDKGTSLEMPGFHALFGERNLPPSMTRMFSKYDLAITWLRSPLLIENLINIGIPTVALAEKFPPPPGSGHVSKFMARPLKEIGITGIDGPPEISLPKKILNEGPLFDGICVHPGSGSKRKNWPVKYFAEAARAASGKTGKEIAVISGPAEEREGDELVKMLGPMANAHFKKMNITSLAALLKSCRLVIGNDSGVSHLAGALGTPVVAVFGPTDPDVWGVAQENASNIKSEVLCAPCSHDIMWDCQNQECLGPEILEMVIIESVYLLNGKNGKN
jgi:ADP-heptose:LPS heptosyltransferase